MPAMQRTLFRLSTIALLLTASALAGCSSDGPTTVGGNTPILPQRRMICRIREAVTGESQSSPAGLDIVHLDASTTAHASVGDTLRVELKMNAGTGYQWKFLGFSPPTSTPNPLTPQFDTTSSTGETVPVPTGLAGGPVFCVFEFRAQGVGSSTLNFALARGWEADTAPTDSRTLTLQVR